MLMFAHIEEIHVRIFWCDSSLTDFRKPLYDLFNQKHELQFYFQWKGVPNTYNVFYGSSFPSDDRPGKYIKRSIYHLMWFLVYIRRFARGIRTSDVFVSLILANPVTLAGIGLAKICHRKVVVWEETFYFQKPMRFQVLYCLLREIAKFVDAFFVCGDEQYRTLRGLGVSGSKIFVANEYPGHNYYQIRARKIEGLDVRGRKVITFIGRFVKTKGVPYLLEAYSKLEKECSNCLLILAGRGPRETELRIYAKELGIRNIVFLGYVSDIEKKKFLFEISSMVVVPSIIDELGTEGGPLVVLEALSAGIPVLGTDACGSSTTFIRDGVNGFVVPHSDPQALLNGMKKLIDWKNKSAVRERVIHEFKKVKGHEYQLQQLEKAILSCFD